MEVTNQNLPLLGQSLDVARGPQSELAWGLVWLAGSVKRMRKERTVRQKLEVVLRDRL